MIYGPLVRVRSTFGPGNSTDLVVEVKDQFEPGGWRELERFNDTDPDALIKADEKARRTRLTILEGEHV